MFNYWVRCFNIVEFSVNFCSIHVDYAQNAIYLVHFVCGRTVVHALKVVPVQLVNAGAA